MHFYIEQDQIVTINEVLHDNSIKDALHETDPPLTGCYAIPNGMLRDHFVQDDNHEGNKQDSYSKVLYSFRSF